MLSKKRIDIKDFLKRIPRPLASIVKDIASESKKRGLEAYIVGGVVRDILMRKENFDIDIVVSSNAVKFAECIAKKKKLKLTRYPQFGTATIFLPGGFHVDFATSRKEIYKYPGALPTVSSGTIFDDLRRRDFTINALAIALHEKQLWDIIDVCAGINDIRKGFIRVLHDKSFIEDPTRIVRAIRFEQRFGFSIEKNTLWLLKKAIKKDATRHVKPPRYFNEFEKLLKETKPGKYIKRLYKLDGLRYISPQLILKEKNFKFLDSLESYAAYFYKSFPRKGLINRMVLFFMPFVDIISFPKTPEIVKKFHIRKKDAARFKEAAKADEILKRLSGKNMLPHEIYRVLKPLSYETLVFLYAKSKKASMRKRIVSFLKDYDRISLWITGQDLKAMGVQSGKIIGDMLKTLLNKKIDGEIKTRLDEKVMAQSLYRK